MEFLNTYPVLKILLCAVVAYYITLIFLYWGRGSSEKRKDKNAPLKKNISGDAVVGKSTYQPGSFRNKAEDKGLLHQKTMISENKANTFVPEIEGSPSSSGEFLNVEFECGYEEEEEVNTLSPEELEDEEIRFYTGNEAVQAKGITFNEMEQAISVLKKESDSEIRERETLETLSEIQQTSLFNNIVEGINTGRKRISEMMNKHDVLIDLPEADEALTSFDLSKFM